MIHSGKFPMQLATTPGEVVYDEMCCLCSWYRSLVAIATRSHAHFEDS